MKLHTITGIPKGRTNWCGPSAVSVITGLPYIDSLNLMKDRRGNTRALKGTSNNEVRAALLRRGYVLAFSPLPDDKPTLARWLRERPKEKVREMALLVVSNHYIVVHGRKACDGWTKSPVFTSEFPKRRRRVEKVWWVREIEGFKPGPVPEAPKKAAEPSARYEQEAYRALHKVTNALHADYKVDRDSYFEMAPCAQFPKGFVTFHYGWRETLDRLERCIADPSIMDEDGSGYSE
jgi:hypothetical protein